MLQVPDRKLRLRAEVIGREALPTLAPAWEDLCARSVEDNVYYAPRYARALINNIDHDSSLRFATVWQGETLAALLPFKRSKIEMPLPGTAARAWHTDYTFSCTPLLDRTRCTDAAAALVDLLGTIHPGEWIIPLVNRQGGVCRAMTEALKKDDRPWQLSIVFERAMLDCAGDFDQHMQTHLSSKRRRDLTRNRRRLEEIGTVVHESHCAGEGLDRAIETFLDIEASGWKGKRGTALACREATRQFARDAFTGDAENSVCRADVLKLSGAPIAVSLVVFAGSTGFTVKCAYDQNYRSYSAGLLLEIEVIRSFLTERWASRLDGATNGAHVIDSLWPGRIEIADLMFSLAPRHASWRLSALTRVEHAKQSVKTAAKAFATSVGSVLT